MAALETQVAQYQCSKCYLVLTAYRCNCYSIYSSRLPSSLKHAANEFKL